MDKPTDVADLVKSVTQVIAILDKNPIIIMNIIIDSNRFYPSSNFLLDDLASKFEMANQKIKINLLFAQESCFELILKESIYNSHDLQRCIAVAPNYRDQLLKGICDDNGYFVRLLQADNNPQQTLSILSNQHPEESEIFSKLYQETIATLSLRR
jgi:hypothetical protein